MATFGERLAFALDASLMDRKTFAQTMGITVQAVGQAINGKGGKPGQLSLENIQKASKVLGVSVHWLRSGEGEMLSPIEGYSGSRLSAQANDLGELFDLIPKSEIMARARAYAAITDVVVATLAALPADAPRRVPGDVGMEGTPTAPSRS